jgi:hypothetical protein
MLDETKVIDKIEVIENGTVQVREATRILKDGEIIAQTYHRCSFVPGSDVSGQPANVQAVANAVWTPEVISAYQAQIAAQAARLSDAPSQS